MKIIWPYSGIALLTASLLLPISSSYADIVVVAPTSSSTGSFTITQDITFTITVARPGTPEIDFILDNWVTYGGGSMQTLLSPKLSLSINGGASQTFLAVLIDDYGNNPSNTLTPGDGRLILTEGPAVAVNDNLTLKAGSYTLGTTAADGFNPQTNQTFTGNMFVGNNDTKISNNVSAVPEPGSAGLLALGVVGLFGRRHRKKDRRRISLPHGTRR